MNPKRAIGPRAEAMGLDVIAIAVDVGPRPVLRRDGHLMGDIEIRRSAVADVFDGKPGALAQIDGLSEPSIGLGHRILGRIGH